MESRVSSSEVKSAIALNQDVKPYETGLVVWAEASAMTTFAQAANFGLHACQLGVPPSLDCTGALADFRKAHASTGIALTAAVCSYAGEDYSNLERVHQSVGFTTPAYRAERIRRTKEIAAFASELGIQAVSCHIGFIPEDPADHLYNELLDLTREICDTCDEYDQAFVLETGQESAAALVGFLSDADKPNLKVNFDPANMVMYGSGDPVEALTLLRPWVLSVHCKDGTLPAGAGTLGKEVRLGDGEVDFPAFLHTLKEIGYAGTLTIEREEPDQAVRNADVHTAIERLNQWMSAAGL